MLIEIFVQNSGLISDMVIQAWHSKVKTIILLHKIGCISQEKVLKTYIKNTIMSFMNEAAGVRAHEIKL